MAQEPMEQDVRQSLVPVKVIVIVLAPYRPLPMMAAVDAIAADPARSRPHDPDPDPGLVWVMQP